jgi:hypothetical protein
MNSASESSTASHDLELLLISPGGVRGEWIDSKTPMGTIVAEGLR